MKYSMIIATITTLFAAQSTSTNVTCDTSSDCDYGEWCYDEWQCVPKCTYFDGVNCTADIGANYTCNAMTGECIPLCNVAGGTNCTAEYGWNYGCNENTGECNELSCNATADPTAFCTASLSESYDYDMPYLGECVDTFFSGYQCQKAGCNDTYPCPSNYTCFGEYSWSDFYCVEDCNLNNYCGPNYLRCNETTGLCNDYSLCWNDSDCLDDEFCIDTYSIGYCMAYCSDTLECPVNYVCEIESGDISGRCVDENCGNSENADYCLDYCGSDCPHCISPTGWTPYCDSIDCTDDANCTSVLGDAYVCDLNSNDCIEACVNNTYCMEIFDTDMTVCNITTGQCEFPCYNDSDCAGLGIGNNSTFICANATNTTAGECEKLPYCVANPASCPFLSAYYGVEFYCNEINGDCEPLYCTDTTDCSINATCTMNMLLGYIDLCYLDCSSNDECDTRFGHRIYSDEALICNSTTSQCEIVAECVADPTICMYESIKFGVELSCNETFGGCDPFNCAETSDCSLNGTICTAVPSLPVPFDVCYVSCWSDWECTQRNDGGSWYCDGGFCINGTRSCSDNSDCDTGYLCDNDGYCILNCTLSPYICADNEYCNEWGYCDTVYCMTDWNCTNLLGSDYYCDGDTNECVEYCWNDWDCIETYNVSTAECNWWSGKCEFPCWNDTDCTELGRATGNFYGCNATNFTEGECKILPLCVGNPWYCSDYSYIDGVEWQCDEESGNCVTSACSKDTDCYYGECITHPVFEYVISMYNSSSDYCYVPCRNDTECTNRVEYFINGGASYCVDGFCVNSTAPTTTAAVVEDKDMVTTDEPNESGVQGYGVMDVLGVIAFMISYVN